MDQAPLPWSCARAVVRCSLRRRRLERNPQPHARRRSEPFERARRRLHPSAFETRDYRLRRVHALGQLLLGETGTSARLESGRVKPSTRTLERLAAAKGLRLRISFEPAPAS